jgi:predicted nucleic acid-binding protein
VIEAVYLDSSALVKLIAPEAETGALLAFLADHPRQVTSRLAHVEVARAATRLGLSEAPRVDAVLAQVSVSELDAEVAALAARLGPVALRTLDAIHLATALRLAGILAAIVTYDDRQADAAGGLGLVVAAPGRRAP